MNLLFAAFWILLIVCSVAWYGFLIFYVGIKAGRDIFVMIGSLKKNPPAS